MRRKYVLFAEERVDVMIDEIPAYGFVGIVLCKQESLEHTERGGTNERHSLDSGIWDRCGVFHSGSVFSSILFSKESVK